MKYKVGDKVRIKSLDWYNQNKDVSLIESTNSYYNFIAIMQDFCGKVMTISSVNSDYYDMVEDAGEYFWTDEMIERLAERDGKIYPYKIGDRVVLKGTNHYATITDLKYNSWGNLSYYIKIDNNDKDISIDYPTELLLPYDNKTEGLVEEKTKPKFKVGDRIITDTNMKGKIIEDVEEGWYRVEFEPYNNISQPNGIVPEESMSLAEEEVGLVDKFSSRWVNEFNLPEGYIFKDENGNIINATKIVLEKKKKEYPKTYKECCKVLGYSGNYNMILTTDVDNKLFDALYRLKVCRDTYWKIAGEEMGLGKPWETGDCQIVYGICRERNNIVKRDDYFGTTHTFEFPIREIRDAFYENFKSEIESCKELL